jgi:hypothetical protein
MKKEEIPNDDDDDAAVLLLLLALSEAGVVARGKDKMVGMVLAGGRSERGGRRRQL